MYLSAGRYEVIRNVMVGLGSERRSVSAEGPCRFCGETDRRQFRKVAHTFSEGLGNKWAVSLDECDRCNNTFSVYESALVSSVAPFLTLGGVKGKNNKVRQTGRTAGPTHVRHSKENGQRRISVVADQIDLAATRDPSTGVLSLTLPIAAERFRPRHGYKALSKMGFSLLPNDELQNYQQLRRSLLEPDESASIPVLEVGLSFAMVGNAPEMVTGTLMRRARSRGLRSTHPFRSDLWFGLPPDRAPIGCQGGTHSVRRNRKPADVGNALEDDDPER